MAVPGMDDSSFLDAPEKWAHETEDFVRYYESASSRNESSRTCHYRVFWLISRRTIDPACIFTFVEMFCNRKLCCKDMHQQLQEHGLCRAHLRDRIQILVHRPNTTPRSFHTSICVEIILLKTNFQDAQSDRSHTRSSGRYIESLQDMALSSRPAEAEMVFEKPPIASSTFDGQSAPFGPVGDLKSAKFSTSSSEKKLERVYYDKDMLANEAVLNLYDAGVEISKIQKCFSIGMLGKKRKLTPTKWSITATDDIISKWLVHEILEMPQINSYETYHFEHLGNLFSIVLFPHRWMYEMIEAWYSGGVLGFGSDHEDARGINHAPAIAGAYHAAKLAVAEHLYERKMQAGSIVLREIRPEYSIPVGVWQVREGVRSALTCRPVVSESLHDSLNVACLHSSISKSEWLRQGNFTKMILQRTISEYTWIAIFPRKNLFHRDSAIFLKSVLLCTHLYVTRYY